MRWYGGYVAFFAPMFWCRKHKLRRMIWLWGVYNFLLCPEEWRAILRSGAH
jgi:hypothetical protein